jgi:hypothetical protein
VRNAATREDTPHPRALRGPAEAATVQAGPAPGTPAHDANMVMQWPARRTTVARATVNLDGWTLGLANQSNSAGESMLDAFPGDP